MVVNYFVACPSIWICLMFFSCLECGCVFSGGRPQREQIFSSLHIKAHATSLTLSLLVLTWPRLRQCLPVFFPSIKLFFLLPPFRAVLFGEKSLGTAHTTKLTLQLLEVQCAHKLFRVLFSLSDVCIQPFIYNSMNSWIFIVYFGL